MQCIAGRSACSSAVGTCKTVRGNLIIWGVREGGAWLCAVPYSSMVSCINVEVVDVREDRLVEEGM